MCSLRFGEAKRARLPPFRRCALTAQGQVAHDKSMTMQYNQMQKRM